MINTMEKTITFRLICEPRIIVQAPAELVHNVEDGWGIVFWNEYGSMQTIIFESKTWDMEGQL